MIFISGWWLGRVSSFGFSALAFCLGKTKCAWPCGGFFQLVYNGKLNAVLMAFSVC